jgi:hypothetical protein
MRKRRPKNLSSKSSRSPKLNFSEFSRFIGISLSGGKSDKACVSFVDKYKDTERLILSTLIERVRTEEFISADLKLHEMLVQNKHLLHSVAVDAPLSLPYCLNCRLKCPGYEVCEVESIRWMRERKMLQQESKHRPRKMFTPYTQRAADLFLSSVECGSLDTQDALGANLAPVTARALFMARRLKVRWLEVSTRHAVWRLGLELRMPKTKLMSWRSSVGGEDTRRLFLTQLQEKTGIFIYHQDVRSLVENHHAFEALVCAVVAFLESVKKTEHPPGDYPKGEHWVHIPTSEGVIASLTSQR